jgi:tRNA-dihydrouridine synthase
MMKNREAALDVLKAARAGFGEPVSVKTRIGYNKIDLDWIKLLLEQKLPALIVHLRTRKEMSDVPAHWELMPEIVRMRDEIQKGIKPSERTLIIGNGDVESLADGIAKCKKYGCDGVMIGRGIFGRPWFFEGLRKSVKKVDTLKKSPEKTPANRLKILLEHTKLFEKTYYGRPTGGKSKKRLKNFAVMKKHFKAYVSGWDGAKELRTRLMETDSYKEVKKVIDEYLAL